MDSTRSQRRHVSNRWHFEILTLHKSYTKCLPRKWVERRAGDAGKWKAMLPQSSRFSLSPSLSALPSPLALEASEIEIILPYQLANQELNQNLRGSYRWWHEQSRRRTIWELASETSSNRWLPFTGLLHTMTHPSRLSFCRNAWALAILWSVSDFLAPTLWQILWWQG